MVGRNGEPHPITAEALASLFRALKDRVRVVLLNACNSESQSAGINEVIDCVIAMSTMVSDQASITFSASFYRAIGFGRSVQDAFEQGKTALMLEGIPEAHVPRLSVREGVDAARVILVNPRSAGSEALPTAAGHTERGPEATELVLLQTEDATVFCPADSVSVRGDSIEMVLRPDPAHAAFLSDLTPRFGKRRLWLAFADSAVRGVAESVERSRERGEERWHVTIAKDTDRGDPMEMGTTNFSSDRIAELRARRILLDERPPSEASPWFRPDPTLEMLVAGLGGGPEIERSPLPALYTAWSGSRADFLAAARLMAVLTLNASHTVEHILELTLSWSGESELAVRFRGRRRKVYSNQPAPEIRFEGACRLTT